MAIILWIIDAVLGLRIIRRIFIIFAFFQIRESRVVPDARFYTREFQNNFLWNAVNSTVPQILVFTDIFYHMLLRS